MRALALVLLALALKIWNVALGTEQIALWRRKEMAIYSATHVSLVCKAPPPPQARTASNRARYHNSSRTLWAEDISSLTPALPFLQFSSRICGESLRARYFAFCDLNHSLQQPCEVQALLWAPCHKQGNWGTGRLWNWPKTESWRHGAGVCAGLPQLTELTPPLWHGSCGFRAWLAFASTAFAQGCPQRLSFPPPFIWLPWHPSTLLSSAHAFSHSTAYKGDVTTVLWVRTQKEKVVSQDQYASKKESYCSRARFALFPSTYFLGL